ncbi:unnamed protein product [Urochloa humidicola]
MRHPTTTPAHGAWDTPPPYLLQQPDYLSALLLPPFLFFERPTDAHPPPPPPPTRAGGSRHHRPALPNLSTALLPCSSTVNRPSNPSRLAALSRRCVLHHWPNRRLPQPSL